MNEGWIKSHRKAQNSDLWKDQNAWRIFQWLLWNVDYKTGKKTFGRKQISQGTGVKESTVYKALLRLRDKYHCISINGNRSGNNLVTGSVTDSVTGQYSEISLLNWDKYQEGKEEVTSEVTGTVSNRSQESNTNKEYKEKEYIYIPEEKPQEPVKKRDFSEKQKLYQRICKFLEETLHTKFTNYPKQMKAIKSMFDAGYTEKQINYVITQMSQEEWYQDKGFDLTTVMNQMPLYKAKARKVMNVSSKVN